MLYPLTTVIAHPVRKWDSLQSLQVPNSLTRLVGSKWSDALGPLAKYTILAGVCLSRKLDASCGVGATRPVAQRRHFV
jgi:hypothetical protein